MMRAFLVYLSQAAWARRLVMRFGFARRTARRFVAGETIEDAFRAVADLNAIGMLATLDLLGEHTHDAAAAAEATRRIADLIDRLATRGLKSNISIKLTQIGLKLDESLCEKNLKGLLQHAAQHGIFVRIDMEESACVDATLRLYHKMRAVAFENVGVVLQSYLYRSEADAMELLQDGTPIRLVKGAYMEPPDRAFPKKTDADANFDRISDLMLHESMGSPASLNGRVAWPPVAAVATHDTKRVEFAKKHAAEIGLPKDKVEFQMLYGIRRDLQAQLVSEGYPVRIYVPFGTEWYPYFMRRLAERPANLWFFLSSLIRG
ncbi:MAG TPA: proline dehydrogenase family protein [Anaerolineales bacterium]|nr:proline dehydrogenase family protein [Anaerolineales bacterium]